MNNFRTALGSDKPYWQINREERNYAALLYFALLSGDQSLPVRRTRPPRQVRHTQDACLE